jgi:hypothetical protein
MTITNITKTVIVFLFLLSLSGIVSGSCNIVAQPAEYSILWDYSSCENVINASVDSYTVFGFDSTSGIYVLRDLQPNQTHKFTLYNEPFGYYSSESTTLSLVKTSQDKIWDFIFEYFLIIIAIILLIIGIKIPLISLISLLISIIGAVSALIKGNFTLDMIFLILIVCSGFVFTKGMKE